MVDSNTNAKKIRSLTRARNVCVIAAVIFPLSLFFLFERQALRLEALADHGQTTNAIVTHTVDGGTFYSYVVEEKEYSWNVAQREAPFYEGQMFSAIYLPEDPSFSRPIANRQIAANEAVANRAFARKTILGVFIFLFMVVAVAQWDLHRLRLGIAIDPKDPGEYRRRTLIFLSLCAPFLFLIGDFHLRDAREKGESLWPAIFGIVISLTVIAGTVLFISRKGPSQVQKRSERLIRWVAPLTAGLGLLRILMVIFGN